MSDQPSEDFDSLSLSAEFRVDAACRRFEAAWKAGQSPRPEDFLGDFSGAARFALLHELIRIDLYRRGACGAALVAGEYLERFPELDPQWMANAVRANQPATEIPNSGGAPSEGATASTVTGISKNSPADRNSALDADREPLPDVPGYAVLRELGRGGMGVVYQARQVALKRVVALKMIRLARPAGPEEYRRFRAEAEAVARLQHPNIVQIHEVGEAAGLPYFSLEFVEGGNLGDKLAGTPLPPADAALLLETLARAMHYAHQTGIIHRDLKPANILLTRDGTPKVTDFGLAKQLDDDSGSTQTGVVMGTPSYMSPEQAGGLTDEIGPLTDVYALGAVLYECLTGRPPFRGASSRETVDQVCSVDPVPPSRLQPGVPHDLETICLACLHKQATRRYASAEALADDLRRFLNGEPIRARRTGAAERAVKWVRRRPAIAALLGAVAAVTLLGFVLVTHQWFRAEGEKTIADDARVRAENDKIAAENSRIEKEKQTVIAETKAKEANEAREEERKQKEIAQKQKKEAEDAKTREEAAKKEEQKQKEIAIGKEKEADDARKLAQTKADDEKAARAEADRRKIEAEDSAYQARRALGSTRVAQAQAALTDNNVGLAIDLLDSVSPEVRFWDWHFLKRQCEGGPISIPELGGFVAFSPDGHYLACCERADILLVDPADGRKRRDLKGHSAPENAPRPVEGFTPRYVTAMAFSPDGKLLISAGTDRTVRIWDVTEGKEQYCFKEHKSAANAVAFSPDGKLAASTGADGVIVWNPADGAVAHRWEGPNKTVAAFAWLADGKRLLLASTPIPPNPALRAEGCEVTLWDFSEGNTSRTLFTNGTARAPTLALAPDGQRFAVAEGNAIKVCDRETGKIVLTLTGHTGVVQNLCASPDGKSWASLSLDGSIRFWDAATGKESARLAVTTKLFVTARVSFTPDGRYLAAGGNRLDLWPVQGGAASVVIHAGTHYARATAWSPDGRRIVSGGIGELRVWNALTGELMQTLNAESGTTYVAVAWSPDGKIVVGGNSHGLGKGNSEVRAWSADTGKEAWKLPNFPGEVDALAFSQDGTILAAGGGTAAKGQIVLLDPANGRELLKFEAGDIAVARLALSPDGKRIASFGAISRYVSIWDAGTGKELNRLLGHQGGVLAVAYSPDGRYLATGGSPSFAEERSEIKLWDRRTGREARVIRSPSRSVSSLAFHPDGDRLVSVDGTGVRVWDISNGQEVLKFLEATPRAVGFMKEIESAAFSPDGGRLAVTKFGEVHVYDGRPSPELLVLKQRSTGAAWTATTADRKRLVSKEDDETLRIWDGTSRRPLFTRPGGPLVSRALAFHLDRELLAFPAEKTAVVLDIRSGRLRATVGGHDGPVWGVYFAQDGRTLASISGGNDGKGGPAPVRILLNEVATGKELLRFAGPPELGAGLVMDADLKQVARPQNDGTAKVWNLAGGDPIVVKQFEPQRLVVWDKEGRSTRVDQFLVGWTDGFRVLDTRLAPVDEEIRQGAFRPDPEWHLSQSHAAGAVKAWGTAIYHLDRLRSISPPGKIDPQRDHDLANNLHNFAELVWQSGRQREAIGGFRRSLALMDEVIAADPKNDLARRNRANSRVYLARCLAEIAEYDESEKQFLVGIKEFEEVSREHPEKAEYLNSLVWAESVHPAVFLPRHKNEETERCYKQGIEDGLRLVEKYPNYMVGRQTLAAEYHDFANFLRTAGRSSEAIDNYRKSETEVTKLLKIAPLNPQLKHDLANTLIFLGQLLGETGTWADAEGPARRALALMREREALLTKIPNLTKFADELSAKSDLATHLNIFAAMARKHGKNAEAEAAYEEALEIAKTMVAKDPEIVGRREDLAAIYHNYALFLLEVGQRPLAAESGFRHSLEIAQKVIGELANKPAARRNLANSHLCLGRALFAQGRTREAGEEFLEAQSEWKKLHEKYPDVAEYEAKLIVTGAERDLARGRHAEATKAAATVLAVKGVEADDLYEAVCFLGRCMRVAAGDDKLAAEKRHELAEDNATRAVALFAEAVKRGWRDAAILAIDPDLAPLRDRPEFKKVAEGMRKPSK
jgi:WD40 repeat protein